MGQFSVMTMVGGVALFIYGMGLARDGLQLVAGDKLRVILHSLSKNRFMAIFVGFAATAIAQSSTATTVMLEGFADAGLIALEPAMGFILGAGIGTTVAVQLISMRLTDYALWLVIAGVLVQRFSGKKRRQHLGQAVLGFGFIFYSIALMVVATAPIRDDPAVKDVLMFFTDKPLWAVASAALLAAALQSSAAVIGIILSLALGGSMTLAAAIPLVVGANIGTCVSALVASARATPEGKRVSWANMLSKVIGAAVVLPFTGFFARLVTDFTGVLAHELGAGENSIARQVAWTHTIFNVGIAVAFTPFISPAAALLRRMIPDLKDERSEFRPKYLDPRSLDTPALAFGHAVREMLRMADIVQEMLDDVAVLLRTNDLDMPQKIHAKDDLADMLDQAIKVYLTQLSRGNMTEEQAKTEMEVLALTSDLENIGDVIDKNLVEICEKKIRLSVRFSDEGWKEIFEFHAKVRENFVLAVTAYTNKDNELAHKVLRHKKHLAQLETEMREAHIKRLHAGLKESFDTSALHLDILTNLRRINSYVTGFAHALINSHRPTAEEAAG